jgi:RNA polymerase sigma-70 factor (ECF subfamily)
MDHSRQKVVIQCGSRRVQQRMNVAPHPLQAPAARPAAPRAARISVAAPTPARPSMPTTDELNEWMQAVAARADRQAFAALFKHFAPRVKGYLLRSGCEGDLAEELTQEAMVLLWRRASTFDPARAALSTWLFTIARNVRIDHHRRRQVSADSHAQAADPWEGDLLPADAALPPDERVLAAQRERGVQRALAELPPEQALVVRLSFFEEHPHAQIAQELGIPLGTVKSRIRLAVAQLRRILDTFGP